MASEMATDSANVDGGDLTAMDESSTSKRESQGDLGNDMKKGRVQTIEHSPVQESREIPYDSSVPEHRVALRTELEAMESLGVWTELVPGSELPDGITAITTRLVVTVKPDNSIKVRLVAREFSNKDKNTDFYVSTSQPWLVRLLLAAALRPGMTAHTCDVSTAFLHADVVGDVYVRLPAEAGGCLVQLHKALYGLRSSPARWFDHLVSILGQIGYRRMELEGAVFVHDNGSVVLAHVDDILHMGTKDNFKIFSEYMSENLRWKVVGELANDTWLRFVGYEFSKTDGHVSVRVPTAYYDELYRDAGFGRVIKGVAHPAEPERREVIGEEPLDSLGATKYRSIVGKLMWLAQQRPDIAPSTRRLAQDMSAPTTGSEQRAKRVVRYLYHAQNATLHIAELPLEGDVEVYTDASWAPGPTRRSVSGFHINIVNDKHQVGICWSSKQQRQVALSSAEAELYGMNAGAAQGIYMKNV